MFGRQDEKFQQSLDALGDRSSWLDRVMKKRVVIHTKDDQSIEGTLMEQVEDGVILRAAKLLNPAGASTPMAGEVFVPRDNVAFAQLDD